MKVCSKCKALKGLESFSKRIGARDGRESHCKECRNTARKIWGKRNPKKVKSLKAKYRKKNKEDINKRAREKWKNDSSRRREQSTNWRKKNKDKSKSQQRRWLNGKPGYLKNRSKSNREKLSNSYIKSLLKGIPDILIDDDLINTKRLIIKIKRYVKNKKESTN